LQLAGQFHSGYLIPLLESPLYNGTIFLGIQTGIVNLKISVVELSPFMPHFVDNFGENDP